MPVPSPMVKESTSDKVLVTERETLVPGALVPEAAVLEAAEGVSSDEEIATEEITAEVAAALLQGVAAFFNAECGRFAGEAAGLSDHLADSEERASNLEDSLQRDQGHRAALEVEDENL
ncbi:hypothetical protein GUJ93_ZPchr0012g19648 [Zizania palustris]|uniref:Uncharacterized protein n=1 Tax=Zizania palustris TaxID=103762 RepID=A0A8J5WUN3_ZIZPA|nr:hypothetical protein GUJ93_ZPchr0012g19648 [Zizania palustris]